MEHKLQCSLLYCGKEQIKLWLKLDLNQLRSDLYCKFVTNFPSQLFIILLRIYIVTVLYRFMMSCCLVSNKEA